MKLRFTLHIFKSCLWCKHIEIPKFVPGSSAIIICGLRIHIESFSAAWRCSGYKPVKEIKKL